MRFNKSTKLYCCIGRILQWNQRNFRALKHSTWYHNNAYMSLYICLNPCMSETKNEPRWKPRTWVTVMCQCRFTGPNQSLSLGMLMMKEAMHTGGWQEVHWSQPVTQPGHVDDEGSYAYGGWQEVCGKPLNLLFNFSVNLKLLIKTKS